jgi:hypothetical protein
MSFRSCEKNVKIHAHSDGKTFSSLSFSARKYCAITFLAHESGKIFLIFPNAGNSSMREKRDG